MATLYERPTSKTYTTSWDITCHLPLAECGPSFLGSGYLLLALAASRLLSWCGAQPRTTSGPIRRQVDRESG
jgi:hypothetical protein